MSSNVTVFEQGPPIKTENAYNIGLDMFNVVTSHKYLYQRPLLLCVFTVFGFSGW